jgi:uncharacterized OB-fold protein
VRRAHLQEGLTLAAAVEQPHPLTIREVMERARTGKLWGRRCLGCQRTTFIDELRCAACKRLEFAAFESKGEGEVVAFTIIAVPAEAFAAYGPFAFSVIRMAEGGSTTGWLPSVRDARSLKVGDRVRVIPAPSGMGIAFEKM